MNVPSMPTTVSGAIRRNATEAQAGACTVSMTQANVPGRSGHHVPPTRVRPVSSDPKAAAIAAFVG
ncbi:hypothetical protein GCM10010339_57240 [Streptomyces alanosinicus]|uniref:Uncharacterized protein n=1 Tax=Streptomyces alanosinicus TaxID=68171 RepID=A0A918YN29_9ACTN|nr:hypothetical protein GCM10010339_57240 [Streptomyces alanosinicus]